MVVKGNKRFVSNTAEMELYHRDHLSVVINKAIPVWGWRDVVNLLKKDFSCFWFIKMNYSSWRIRFILRMKIVQQLSEKISLSLSISWCFFRCKIQELVFPFQFHKKYPETSPCHIVAQFFLIFISVELGHLEFPRDSRNKKWCN